MKGKDIQDQRQSDASGLYPVEIIHPAGMLLVGILGRGNRLEIAHANSRFQSFICSIVKNTFECLILEGREVCRAVGRLSGCYRPRYRRKARSSPTKGL